MKQCEHCGRDTPDEAFCTWCGAHRAGVGSEARGRRKDYAASTGEHVNQPSVITTLLPHLPRHKVHEFRWGLIGGLAVVVALVGGGLIVAAILAAAVLVPSLYLVYLYEAQVYRDEPAKILGLTLAAGIVLGVVVSIIADALLHEVSPLRLSPTTSFLLGSTVLLPIVQEALKPLPVLLLRGNAKFSETIDGLTFGVAAGLGFAGAETIVQFSKVISTEPVRTASSNWLFPVIAVTVLTPLMQGTCTGVIAAVLWKPKRLSQPLYALRDPLGLRHAHLVLGDRSGPPGRQRQCGDSPFFPGCSGGRDARLYPQPGARRSARRGKGLRLPGCYLSPLPPKGRGRRLLPALWWSRDGGAAAGLASSDIPGARRAGRCCTSRGGDRGHHPWWCQCLVPAPVVAFPMSTAPSFAKTVAPPSRRLLRPEERRARKALHRPRASLRSRATRPLSRRRELTRRRPSRLPVTTRPPRVLLRFRPTCHLRARPTTQRPAARGRQVALITD